VAHFFWGDIGGLAVAQLPVRGDPVRSAHPSAAQCFVDSVMDIVRLFRLRGKESPYVHRVAVTIRARMMRRERAWWLMIQASAQRDSDRRTRSSRIACSGHHNVGVVRERLPHTASVPLPPRVVTQLASLTREPLVAAFAWGGQSVPCLLQLFSFGPDSSPWLLITADQELQPSTAMTTTGPGGGSAW